MKNRFFLGLSLFALIGVFIINGCKSTATDPTYVALAEIRFADFHQADPVQFYLIPPNASSHDSASLTPTPLTYGIITPYITNIPTNRTVGETYHLRAVNATTHVAEGDEYVTLKPGDKYTWLITGNPDASGGKFDTTLINDAIPSNKSSLAWFRFVNVVPNSTLSLRVGDPLAGQLIGTQKYDGYGPYVGIPFGHDTSVTFYVVDQNGSVLSLLSGIEIDTGSYKTVTWGGQDQNHRITINGGTTLNDTSRIRIWDDNSGVDFYGGSVPQSFRYNFINALIPPSPDTNRIRKTALVDYTQSPNNGLAVIINDNSDYNYNHLQPFSFGPSAYADPNNSNVVLQVPNVISPFNPVSDKIYFKLVAPFNNGASPSSSDSILFRFFSGLSGSTGVLKNDQQYTIIVYDTVKKSDPKQPDYVAPYDSANGVATIPVPLNPIQNSAIILFGNMLAPLKSVVLSNTNKAKFVISGVTRTNKVALPKTYDTVSVPAGTPVTITATVTSTIVSSDPDYTFTLNNPESGAIYEVFLVGKRDPNVPYTPKWVAVRVNPK
jgi:hypothetical protein